MSILAAAILGVVEGVSEFLPISSTGHLVLAARLLQVPTTEFLKTFEVVIQSGAILAALVAYGGRLIHDRRLLLRVLMAFVPTAGIGLLAYPLVKSMLGSSSVVLWALGIGGVLLILFEKKYHEPADAAEDLARLPYRSAVLIGVAQCLALVPGVSRSATTIVAGLMLGLSRRAIVEFSFLLAIPTLGAATALDLYKQGPSLTASDASLLATGFLAAAVVAFITMRWLLRYVRSHDFTAFGVYRIVVALALWAVLA